ncbi:MAG: hypothetical protein VB954_12210 [Thalassolituus sp.]|jgi:hypothetical protein|nr:hypothetical protein [Thalassolituus oleivorans]|tara:strand:+ start:601 stop:1728 length:1128 start_codon:yes stop_codon:yes gene_type:complete
MMEWKFKRFALPTIVATTIICSSMLLVSACTQAQDWWTMSDADFAAEYSTMALNDDVEGQSEVAWMLFSRVNQRVNFNGKDFSQWEIWPSNEDTFSPAVKAFSVENKVRTRPHLQEPKIFLAAQHQPMAAKFSMPPNDGGEEVTRNLISYKYIMQKNLNSKAGVWNTLSTSPKIDFPIGTVEIKGDWVNSAVDGAYQLVDSTTNTTYSLLGLHIMAKMAPTPDDPFHSETPSWFWTTFEFKGNPGLANAQSLITYPDQLSQAQYTKMLVQSGLGKTAFVNYRSNGTQIRYSDAKNPNIILGNTKMEDFAGVPDGSSPDKWTAWNSSCHTCHGTTSGNPTIKAFYPFTVSTGKITDPKIDKFTSLDFVWSIAFHAR